MDLQAKRASAAVSAPDDENDPYGSFDIILSSPTRDRDGEVVSAKSWQLPLPASIPINVDHSPSVSDVIGSGQPWIDADGNLRVKGTFASSPAAQHVRGLVREGHVQSVSVEFLRRKSANGEPVNELVGGAFVSLPANPDARVLASKAAVFQAGLDAILSAKSGGGDAAMLQAIHDAAGHLGAECVKSVAFDDEDEQDEDGAADGANKALALLALRVKALSR